MDGHELFIGHFMSSGDRLFVAVPGRHSGVKRHVFG